MLGACHGSYSRKEFPDKEFPDIRLKEASGLREVIDSGNSRGLMRHLQDCHTEKRIRYPYRDANQFSDRFSFNLGQCWF